MSKEPPPETFSPPGSHKFAGKLNRKWRRDCWPVGWPPLKIRGRPPRVSHHQALLPLVHCECGGRDGSQEEDEEGSVGTWRR